MKRAAKRDAFDDLGNSYRRDIVEMLASRPRSVQEIADRMPISRPAVSRHLRVLTRAGLVGDEQRGTRRLYRLEGEGVDEVRRYLEGVWGEAATRFRLYTGNTAPPEAGR